GRGPFRFSVPASRSGMAVSALPVGLLHYPSRVQAPSPYAPSLGSRPAAAHGPKGPSQGWITSVDARPQCRVGSGCTHGGTRNSSDIVAAAVASCARAPQPAGGVYRLAAYWSATLRSCTRPVAYSIASPCPSANGGWKPTPSHCWVCAFHRSLP